MTHRISSSTLSPSSLSYTDADPKTDSKTTLKPAKSHLRPTDVEVKQKTIIGSSNTVLQEPLAHVTDVTSHAPEAGLGMGREEVTEVFHQIATNLAPFLLLDSEKADEEALNQIFVFNEKGDHLELHENRLETDLSMEASHEAVKTYFADQLTILYGESAVNVLYPNHERDQPLTLGKAHDLITSFAELQNSVITACDGDLSQYDNCLAAQLKTLEELKFAIANPPPASPLESSTIEYLSKQTGLPSYMIYAGMVAGGILVAGATTSGLGLPVAFHAAMMTASAHTPLLGAAASVSAGGKAATGLWMGMSTSVVHAQYGTAALATLGHINTPTAIGAGTGAFIGAAGGGIAAAGPAESPSSTGKIIAGMLTGAAAGALLGGLSVAFTPTTIGSSVAAGGGSVGALVGTFHGGRSGGSRGATVGFARGAAAGLALGGGITLFGGLCSAVAVSATAAAGTSLPIGYGGVTLGTAAASYIAVGPERVNAAVRDAVSNSRNPIADHSSNYTTHRDTTALVNSERL
ncbi:MAG: hypothetical protein ACOYK6_00755 [Chthoniobacterales bacterium]